MSLATQAPTGNPGGRFVCSADLHERAYGRQAARMDFAAYPTHAPTAWLLALSGGLDSTVLLHRLHQEARATGRRLRAVHVHHGLHALADEWAAAAQAQCDALGIHLSIRHVAVNTAGRGLEAAAREARYAALSAERKHDECVVLAHHRDDQAETVLLALLRGSGEQGLAGMRGFTEDQRGPLWRPMLGISRAEIAAYATAHALTWQEDPSNASLQHDRNFVRHEVMLLLRKRWPQADASLAHSAKRLADADAALQADARRHLALVQGLDPATLNAKALAALPRDTAARVLRLWVTDHGSRFSSDALARVLNDWPTRPEGKEIAHPLGSLCLRQWGGTLYLTPRQDTNTTDAIAPDFESRPWTGTQPLALAEGGTIRLLGASALETPLQRVERAAAGRFKPAGHAHQRSLQTMLHSLGIPPWERAAVPLLADAQGRLQAIGDLAYAEPLDAWLREHKARLLWQRAGG